MTSPTAREKRMEHDQRSTMESNDPSKARLNDTANKLNGPIAHETIKDVQKMQEKINDLQYGQESLHERLHRVERVLHQAKL